MNVGCDFGVIYGDHPGIVADLKNPYCTAQFSTPSARKFGRPTVMIFCPDGEFGTSAIPKMHNTVFIVLLSSCRRAEPWNCNWQSPCQQR